ncbi:hypothetical protein CY35_13G071800 [Sphagnum magellanicum]|nr:hypothetical protein CY35_13G071800 [Sphagnum magellanicum]
MALVSSSITIPTEVTHSEWTLSNKMTLISLHPPGIQCSSPVTPVEPKQMGTLGSLTEPECMHTSTFVRWKLIKEGSCIDEGYNPDRRYRLNTDQ